MAYRIRHSPSVIRECLFEVIANGRGVTAVAKEKGVERWTLQHWVGDARKQAEGRERTEGIERVVLHGYTKGELVDHIINLKKAYGA